MKETREIKSKRIENITNNFLDTGLTEIAIVSQHFVGLPRLTDYSLSCNVLRVS